MTPDDVAAIRSQAKAGYAIGPFHVMALIVALEAAWAERDALLEEVKDYEDSGLTEGRARHWRERAERAEAELRLSDLALASSEGWRDKYEAALARVRALCDRHADWGWRSAYVRDIRAAIEGDIR